MLIFFDFIYINMQVNKKLLLFFVYNVILDRFLDWREVFNIVIQYRRLVDLEQLIFWVDKMLDYSIEEGYYIEINFIK